jgi:hypothetical protein
VGAKSRQCGEGGGRLGEGAGARSRRREGGGDGSLNLRQLL